MTITATEFSIFKTYIENHCGILLAYGKEYLLEGRLSPLLEQSGARSYTQFYQMLQNDSGELKKKLVDAITINETYWFRDDSLYDALSNKVFPMLIELAKKRKVRIWSAACSTGQEPYSLAILLNEALKKAGAGAPPCTNFEFVATDISPSAIFMAISGRYNKFDISRGMSNEFLSDYFEEDGSTFKLSSQIKSMVKFKQWNLMESFNALGEFDLILCRNVLFYFSDDLKKSIYAKLHGALADSGLLSIGGSEVLYRLTENFASIKVDNAVLYYHTVTEGAPGGRLAMLANKLV